VSRAEAVIRPMTDADWDGWKPLWDGYLHFYREDLDDKTTKYTFDRLCARSDNMFGFVAESDGELVGFVHSLLHPSTWTTTTYCNLEDLYVSPAARGTNSAKKLIEAVGTEAKSLGAAHVYWHTQEFNSPARSLYDQVAHLTSFRMYEM